MEADTIEVAGAMFYSMLPMTFFRGKNRLVAIRPKNLEPVDQKMLAGGAH